MYAQPYTIVLHFMSFVKIPGRYFRTIGQNWGYTADMSDFSDWLNSQLDDRGWSFRELSRRSGLSTTQISDIANDKINPGLESCVSIARAFALPPEDILRRAGRLPALPPAVQEEQEAISLMRCLPSATRTIALNILRTLAGAGLPPAPTYTINEESPTYEPDPLTAELLTTFRQLPEEWQQEALNEIERLKRYANQVRIIGDENEKETPTP